MSGGCGGGGGGAGPCGACKFLRRKCVKGCIFAPYFDTEQGSTHFAAVHKVFGASNVSKLLLRIPVQKRLDAVITICYEALARIRDPVYGCVSHIFALQQQVVNLQAELALIQADLATFELPSHAIQPFQSPSPALPSNHDQSSNMLTTTPDITTHIGPSQSLHDQPVVDSSATCCSPSEPPLDDDDLHAVAREFFSRCLPGGRFHPSDPC